MNLISERLYAPTRRDGSRETGVSKGDGNLLVETGNLIKQKGTVFEYGRRKMQLYSILTKAGGIPSYMFIVKERYPGSGSGVISLRKEYDFAQHCRNQTPDRGLISLSGRDLLIQTKRSISDPRSAVWDIFSRDSPVSDYDCGTEHHGRCTRQ